MTRVDGWAQLIENAIADHEMRKRFSNPAARDLVSIRSREIRHVLAVVRHRNRGDPDVVVILEKERRSGAAGIGNAVSIRRPAGHRAADDLTLTLPGHEIDCRLDDR